MAFERVKAGWSLARSVRRMVSGDRGLLVYPVLSGIIGVILFALSFVGALLIPISAPIQWKVIAGFFISYVVTAFMSTYFLVAMLIAFKAYESGQAITIRDSLSRTRPYSKRIFQWAVFYTILVMLLRLIESRFRGVSGLIVAGLGSAGIAIATFFAVPAILEKKLGPIDAVKDSLGTIRRTIGPIFGGVAYIDLYTLMFTLLGVFIAVAGFTVMPTIALKLFVVATGVVLMVLGFVLNFTYYNIFKLLLYDYFNGQKLPDEIDENLVQAAIKRRSKPF